MPCDLRSKSTAAAMIGNVSILYTLCTARANNNNRHRVIVIIITILYCTLHRHRSCDLSIRIGNVYDDNNNSNNNIVCSLYCL